MTWFSAPAGQNTADGAFSAGACLRRKWRFAATAGIAAVCLLLSAAVPMAQSVPSRHKWWQDTAVQRRLGLSLSQVTALERAFQQNLPQRVALRAEIGVKDRELQRLLEHGDVDDATVMRLSAEVEQLRAKRNVGRTLMLLKMYRVLTAEQRTRLRDIDPPGL